MLVWGTGCTYWYVCQIKGLCPEGWNLLASTAVTTPATTPTTSEVQQDPPTTASPEDTTEVGSPPTNGNPTPTAEVPSSLEAPKTILFAFAGPQSESQSETDTYLDELAGYLKANPSRKALVRGYTDDTAARENNLKLAQRRCDVIVSMLQERAVDPGQIITEPLGEADPVATNDTPEGRRLNRRVVISIQL